MRKRRMKKKVSLSHRALVSLRIKGKNSSFRASLLRETTQLVAEAKRERERERAGLGRIYSHYHDYG